MCNNLIRGIIPLGGNQMNRILAVAILLGVTGCSYTQPYVTNIAPEAYYLSTMVTVSPSATLTTLPQRVSASAGE